MAAQKGHVGIVELLCLEKSFQIDVADDKGQTPLHIACRRGHHELVKVRCLISCLIINKKFSYLILNSLKSYD